jgi:hypothetical protein
MTTKPQFEHKKPGFFLAGSYNVTAFASQMSPQGGGLLAYEAGGNDMFGFGLTAEPERGAAAGGRAGHVAVRQMGLPQ